MYLTQTLHKPGLVYATLQSVGQLTPESTNTLCLCGVRRGAELCQPWCALPGVISCLLGQPLQPYQLFSKYGCNEKTEHVEKGQNHPLKGQDMIG